jgi:protein-export membrane protein SecD
MKRCPTCSRVYDDLNLRFCLDDGTALENRVPAGGVPETLVMPETHEAQPTLPATPPVAAPFSAGILPIQAAAKPRHVWPWLLGAAAFLLLVGLISAFAVVGRLVKYAKKPLVHHLVMQVKYDEPTNRDYLVTGAVAVIKGRLNALGISSFEVKPGAAGSGQILVNLPRVDDPERVKKIISTWGKLEFCHVVSPPGPSITQTFASEEKANAWLKQNQNINGRPVPYPDEAGKQKPKWVIVEVPAIIDEFDLRDAIAIPSGGGGADYEVQFSLKKDGAEHFGTWTASHINEYLGIVLNDEVKSIAYIKSQISDQGVITGRYTKQSAEDLALVLKAGALPVPVEFVEEKIDN